MTEFELMDKLATVLGVSSGDLNQEERNMSSRYQRSVLRAALSQIESPRSPGCSTPVGWVLQADDGVVRGFKWADNPNGKAELELQKRHFEETGSNDAKVFAVYGR